MSEFTPRQADGWVPCIYCGCIRPLSKLHVEIETKNQKLFACTEADSCKRLTRAI